MEENKVVQTSASVQISTTAANLPNRKSNVLNYSQPYSLESSVNSTAIPKIKNKR